MQTLSHFELEKVMKKSLTKVDSLALGFENKEAYSLNTNLLQKKDKFYELNLIVPKGVVVYNGIYLAGRVAHVVFGAVPDRAAICSLLKRKDIQYSEKDFYYLELSNSSWMNPPHSLRVFNRLLRPNREHLSLEGACLNLGDYPFKAHNL